MDRKLEDIQNVSSAIFGEDNVDISIGKDVYIITQYCVKLIFNRL